MTDDATAPVEKVSQETMLQQFRERFNAAIEENKQLSEKIKQNEVVALKLQGAIEALEYYNENPPTPCELNLNKPLVLFIKSKLCPTFTEPPK